MRILYLTFYFEPDLGAGSFRNTTLAKELALQCRNKCEIDIITSQPNRYKTFKINSEPEEKKDNITLYRIKTPFHKNGMIDQALSFQHYFTAARKIAKNKKYDLVFASSSRLFTAFLGYTIAKSQKIPLYLDIRDIFVETMSEVLTNSVIKGIALPILKEIEKKTFNYATHINLISEGFKPYFSKYRKAKYSYFTNGIDEIFIKNKNITNIPNGQFTIVYAGNIGDGQGLHKIIPQAALKLGNNYKFKIIGDGGAKPLLIKELDNLKVRNVELLDPIPREKLIGEYNNTDFLFLHLNDYNAFKRVLPSKIFELATFNKPIVAGVNGYAYEFIETYVPNHILFNPCDVDSMVDQLMNYKYINEERKDFKNKFSRENINKEMAKSILNYLNNEHPYHRH
jgi:hypothetical protein